MGKLKLKSSKTTIQLILAVLLVLAGMALLFLGFYAVPVGEISASVLTAFGEMGTFAGALLGIDYTYKYKMASLVKGLDAEDEDEEKED